MKKSEQDFLFLDLKTIFKQLNNQINELFSILFQIDEKELKKLPFQTVEDIYKITAAIKNEEKEIKQFLAMMPSFGKDLGQFSSSLPKIRHNLRTYIGAIRGYAEMVIESLESTQETKYAMTIAKLTLLPIISNKMLSLIDKLKENTDIPLSRSPPVMQPQGGSLKIELPIIAEHSPMEAEEKSSDYQNMVQPAHSNVIHIFQELTHKAQKSTKIDKGSILIVDDVESNCTLLQDWLKRKSYSVFAANNGAQALAFLTEHPNIDIILLDIMMPEMDGFEVLKRIKMNERLADIIVIMITSLDEVDSIVLCIKDGAEDYMVKPFNSFLLDVKIKSCLEKKRLRDTEKAYIASLYQELNFAQPIQLSMMPRYTPKSERYSIYGKMIPAKEVGGDFYDWYELGHGKISIVIGDVSGKGSSAALYMVQMRTILNTLASAYSTIADNLCDFIKHANLLQCKDNESCIFVTLFYGILDIQTGQFIYVNAGHLPPLILKANNSVELLAGFSGLPMGISPNTTYNMFTTTIEHNSTLLLYTDGITEALNSEGIMYGVSRLEQTLQDSVSLSAERAIEKVLNSVLTFTANEEATDDITALALHFF
jgi:sigma-B regulation protein RsbU (phosphoserine phosphatase)